MHKALLEALRHREQDIMRYVVILVSALGGFAWLFQTDSAYRLHALVVGTYGVILVFLLGAFYALALGYNYRSLTFQLALLERRLKMQSVILAAWPGAATETDGHFEAFRKKSRWGVIPWCTPPEIVKFFWVAFVLGILLVTPLGFVASDTVRGPAEGNAAPEIVCFAIVVEQVSRQMPLSPAMDALRTAIPYVGAACFLLAALGPVYFGRKMLRLCDRQRRADREREASEEAEE